MSTYGEYIRKYKDQKAYSYWKSNFVDAILYTNFGQKCFVKCKVTQNPRANPPNRHQNHDLFLREKALDNFKILALACLPLYYT